MDGVTAPSYLPSWHGLCRTNLLYDGVRRRDNSLTLVRLRLAVLVIFGHSFALRDRDTHLEWLMRVSRGQTSAGELAVNAFFVLSGFLIVQSAQDSRSWADYLPVPGAVNPAMWTIRYEFWCYLGVAALGIAGLLNRSRFCLTLFSLLFAANAAQEVYVLRHHLNIVAVPSNSPGSSPKSRSQSSDQLTAPVARFQPQIPMQAAFKTRAKACPLRCKASCAALQGRSLAV